MLHTVCLKSKNELHTLTKLNRKVILSFERNLLTTVRSKSPSMPERDAMWTRAHQDVDVLAVLDL